MKMQKRFLRKYKNKDYYKYMVNIPPMMVREAGFKEGEDLDIDVKDGKLTIKRKKKEKDQRTFFTCHFSPLFSSQGLAYKEKIINSFMQKEDWKQFIEEINSARRFNGLGDKIDVQTWDNLINFCKLKQEKNV